MKYSKEQVVNIVEIMISAALSNLHSTVPPRFIDGSHDDSWKRDMADFDKCWNRDSLYQATLNHLGCNLSCLFADITDDGMGTGDALDCECLEGLIGDWFRDLCAGRVGYSNNVLQLPDVKVLAGRWVNRAFKGFEFEARRWPSEHDPY